MGSAGARKCFSPSLSGWRCLCVHRRLCMGASGGMFFLLLCCTRGFPLDGSFRLALLQQLGTLSAKAGVVVVEHLQQAEEKG